MSIWRSNRSDLGQEKYIQGGECDGAIDPSIAKKQGMTRTERVATQQTQLNASSQLSEDGSVFWWWVLVLIAAFGFLGLGVWGIIQAALTDGERTFSLKSASDADSSVNEDTSKWYPSYFLAIMAILVGGVYTIVGLFYGQVYLAKQTFFKAEWMTILLAPGLLAGVQGGAAFLFSGRDDLALFYVGTILAGLVVPALYFMLATEVATTSRMTANAIFAWGLSTIINLGFWSYIGVRLIREAENISGPDLAFSWLYIIQFFAFWALITAWSLGLGMYSDAKGSRQNYHWFGGLATLVFILFSVPMHLIFILYEFDLVE